MEDLSNAFSGLVQTLEDLTTGTTESALQAITQKIDENTAVKEKKREEFKKKITTFQEVVVNHFSEIDKQELHNVLTEVTTLVNKGDEKSYKEAMKTIDKFVKKYNKKK